MKTSTGYKVFTAFNYLLMTAMILLCAMPLWHIAMISLSAPGPAAANEVGLWPVGFMIDNYTYALSQQGIVSPFLTSVLRLVLGVAINMLMVIMAAYPLSKESKDFPGKTVYSWVFIFVMLFNGGIIPNYVLVKSLGLIDSIWALVLPGAVSVFYMIIMLNFFRQLPKELEEAAFIDGASHFRTLIRIYLPLSIPSIATLTLFAAVGHWNSWFDGLIYMRDPNRYPLTTYMQSLLSQLQRMTSSRDAERLAFTSRRGLMMAYIVITLLPILCMYPFLQKYVRSGLVLGSVKG